MSVLRWSIRVAIAFARGWIVRMLRRVAHRPPRIWHGFTPMFFTRALIEADRLAGFPARSVAQHTDLQGYALVRPEEFDAVYSSGGDWRSNNSHWRCLIDLLVHADIWFAFFDAMFFPSQQAWKNAIFLRIVRMAGIRIVVSAHGGDVNYLDDAHRTRFDWIRRMQLDYPNWDLRAAKTSVVARTSLFCRHASLVICDSYMQPFVPCRALDFPYVTIDTREITPTTTPHNARPLIIHAPNHRNMKGTDILLECVERLRTRGFELDLQLIERVPRQEALQIYATADIVADQFIIGGFGAFACESMALAKPVITYLDEAHLLNPVYTHPLINGNAQNLDRVLAALVAVPQLRTRLGAAGRVSVERYQSSTAVGEVLKVLYEHVWWGRPLELEKTTMFESARKPRALTEDPADEYFWPVPVNDLLDAIRVAVDRVS